MPSSMLHHCIYFLIGVTRIYYYSSCTRWLLVLISRAPARGHPRGGGQRIPGGTSHLGYAVPRSTYRQRTRTSAVLSGDAIPERAQPVATTPAPVAVATDPSGCRAPTAGVQLHGEGARFCWAGRQVQSSCSDWESRSPSPPAVKITAGTESEFGETGARQAPLRGCWLSVRPSPLQSCPHGQGEGTQHSLQAQG